MKDSVPSRARPEERSAAILQAAFEEFAQEGFAAARMESIAARAGVTKGLIYFYYKNKQELFEAVFRQCVKEPFHGTLLDVDPAESMASHLARVLSSLYHQLMNTPFFAQLVRLILLEGKRFPEIHAYYYREIVQPGMDVLHALLEEGARRGEWKETAIPEFIQTMVAPCIMFVLWRMALNQYKAVDVERYCQDHQRVLLRSLGLNEQAVKDAMVLAARKLPEKTAGNAHSASSGPVRKNARDADSADLVKLTTPPMARRSFTARATLRRRPKES